MTSDNSWQYLGTTLAKIFPRFWQDLAKILLRYRWRVNPGNNKTKFFCLNWNLWFFSLKFTSYYLILNKNEVISLFILGDTLQIDSAKSTRLHNYTPLEVRYADQAAVGVVFWILLQSLPRVHENDFYQKFQEFSHWEVYSKRLPYCFTHCGNHQYGSLFNYAFHN